MAPSLVRQSWTRLIRRSAPVVFAVAACGEPGTAPPHALPSLTVRGTVQDSASHPAAGALARVTLWLSDTLVPTRSAFTVTDSLGAFVMRLDSLPTAPADSLQLETSPAGCTYRPQYLVLRDAALPVGPDPEVQLVITQAMVPQPASSSIAQFCGYGVHPMFGPRSYDFGLGVDSIRGGDLWGKWHVRYHFSSGDDEGSFQGVTAAGHVLLTLTQDIVWNNCLSMQLDIPVAADGAWGPALVVEPQTCVAKPMAFMFVPDTVPFLFP